FTAASTSFRCSSCTFCTSFSACFFSSSETCSVFLIRLVASVRAWRTATRPSSANLWMTLTSSLRRSSVSEGMGMRMMLPSLAGVRPRSDARIAFSTALRRLLPHGRTLAAPEPDPLTLQPWDKSPPKTGEKAILPSDLGLTPANDGNIIRIPIPSLTEERRKELVKVIHKFAEEGRVAVRHARTEAISRIKKTEHVSEDEKKHAEKDVQKVHDDHLRLVDAAVKAKEAEIMEV